MIQLTAAILGIQLAVTAAMWGGYCLTVCECNSACERKHAPVRQKGQLLCAKLVLIKQHMVVAGPVGALDPRMAVEVEVKLCWVADVPVNQGSCRCPGETSGNLSSISHEACISGRSTSLAHIA